MRKILLAILCVATVLSCSPPPFNALLEQSAMTVKNLNLDNATVVAMASSKSFYGDESNQVFLPQLLSSASGYTFDYTGGLYIALSSGSWGSGVDIHAIEGATSAMNEYDSETQSIVSSDSHYPSYLGWPLKSGPSLFGIVFDSETPTNNGFAVYMGDPSASVINQVDGGPLGARVSTDLPGMAGAVIGASVFPMSGSFDQVHMLVSDMAGNYGEASYQVSSAGLANAFNPRSPLGTMYGLGLPGFTSVTLCQYFYHELNHRSYASWYDTATASWKCYSWWEDSPGVLHTPQQLTGVSNRVDALLSTGELLSTQDGTGRLYDTYGTLEATFPLGDLKLIAEEYVNGVARTYFSLYLPYDNTLHFNVYWIETASLRTLGS